MMLTCTIRSSMAPPFSFFWRLCTMPHSSAVVSWSGRRQTSGMLPRQWSSSPENFLVSRCEHGPVSVPRLDRPSYCSRLALHSWNWVPRASILSSCRASLLNLQFFNLLWVAAGFRHGRRFLECLSSTWVVFLIRCCGNLQRCWHLPFVSKMSSTMLCSSFWIQSKQLKSVVLWRVGKRRGFTSSTCPNANCNVWFAQFAFWGLRHQFTNSPLLSWIVWTFAGVQHRRTPLGPETKEEFLLVQVQHRHARPELFWNS
jgi:hypothetical protein